MVKASGLIVEFFNAGNFTPLFVGLRVVGIFDDGDACTLGEFFDGLDKGEVLILHEEGESIATLAAAEAFVVLASLVDVERGSLFTVEGAIHLKVPSRTFEREVGTDQIDNIRRGEDLLDCFWRNAAHGEIVNRMFGLRQLWVMVRP